MLVEHQVSKVSSGMILAKLKGWLAGLGMVLALVAMLSSVTRVDAKSDAEATLIAWSGRGARIYTRCSYLQRKVWDTERVQVNANWSARTGCSGNWGP